jgi:hypothetical protein
LTSGRHSREIAFVLARWALLLLLSCGCQKEPEAAPRPRASAPVPSAGPSPGTAAVASVVQAVRERELRLGAPGWQLQPLAFGKNLFVRLAGDRVEAYSIPSGSLLFESPVEDARGAVEIAGGSVVVVARMLALRIDPGAKQPVRLPPVPFLPGTVLVPDRKDSTGLWSVHTASRVLARNVLDISGKRSLEGVVTLADYDGGPVTAMRDGTLIYRASDGVCRSLPGGRAQPLKTDFVPWRLLPGRRVDQAWAVAADGEVELWQIGERIRVVHHYALEPAPYDAAASSDYFAAVVVREGGGTPRRFQLIVLSEESGELVLRQDLETKEPPDTEQWAEVAGRDLHVALADDAPFIAVGGPGGVRVTKVSDGSTILAR